LFQQAGLKNTSEKEVAGKMNCGTTDVYWNMMTEVAAPFVAALSNADDTSCMGYLTTALLPIIFRFRIKTCRDEQERCAHCVSSLA
jgi:hypothetical protein